VDTATKVEIITHSGNYMKAQSYESIVIG